MTSPCPSADRLRDWVAGRLGAVDAAAVEGHVEGCRGCQAALDGILPSGAGASGGSISVFVRRLAGSLPAEVLRDPGPPPRAAGDAEESSATSGSSDTSPPGSTAGGARSAAKPGGPLPGLVDYEVLRVLGRGGMGVVYLARHRRLKRLTAVKMLSDRLVEEPRHWSRLTREAEVLARLRHPNVVQVYDVTEQDGRPLLAMEYVEGGTLGERYRNRPAEPGEAARLVERVARGVHAAHRAGVVHRDLKPANVLLDGDEPKVSDFGLAKEVDSGDSLTPTGAVVGTPQYMAPEQVVGGPGAWSESVDVYALGAVLYDLLTGRPPHVGSSVYETLDLVRRRPPVPPGRLRPGLPAELERICLRCLEKNPARRFESAEAVAEALAAFQARWAKAGGLPAAAEAGRGLRRRAAVGGAALCCAALLTFAAVRLAGGGGEAKRDDPSASGGVEPASSPARDAGLDPVPAGSSWVGTFAFLPAPEGQVDGDARLEVETRRGDEFTGTYASEGGRYAWKVRGAVRGGRVRWEFTEAVRDNMEGSVVGRVSVDGTVSDGAMDLTWREPLSEEEARIALRRE